MWPLLGYWEAGVPQSSVAVLSDKASGQTFYVHRVTIEVLQGMSLAQLHRLCGFITVGLKNTNQTAENQAQSSASASEHVLYTVLRLVCLSINAYIDGSSQ